MKDEKATPLQYQPLSEPAAEPMDWKFLITLLVSVIIAVVCIGAFLISWGHGMSKFMIDD